MAMLEYAETGEEPIMTGSERYVWPSARQSINNTREKSEQMKANASRREQREANENKPEQNEAKPSRLFDKDKDKDKDIKSTNVLSPRTCDVDRLFDKFWSIYPRREGKQDARKAFVKLKPDIALLETMVNAITAQKKSSQWQEARYIPHPATWLNGHRWEDEPTKDTGKRMLSQQYEQREYNEEKMREILGTDDLFK